MCISAMVKDASWPFYFKFLLNMNMNIAQSCPTLCNPMDYTVHGILQARILEWVAFSFSRGSSQPRDHPQCRRILYQLSHKGSLQILEWVAYPFSRESSRPRNWTGVFCLTGKFFANWATRGAQIFIGVKLIYKAVLISGYSKVNQLCI